MIIFDSMTKTDSYYEFTSAEGKLILPSVSVILVDDESDYTSIKLVATRATVGLLKK